MTWSSRLLNTLYATTSTGLAWTAELQFRYGLAWAGCLFGAACVVPVIAVVRESVLCDLRRETAAHAAGRTRPPRASTDRARGCATEATVRTELGAACCERWWTSLGTDHDTACRAQSRRSSAA
ncbi:MULTISPECIES: hypothetical protein [unclassified Streptomyces]|uniref:hypothetical protein n=1 Tax=unclassified Streptomyces TaxID=2593676 RepID=UPI001F049EF1|nr:MULTISPECIES: hypothetical protein [unclassified Streptomyces]MCH0566544.1 hypothetical protein [Streptomyces sp. MUM 2J]MCH0571824.1 hypothetical protein [Streptomyces sp. MUM 136J]